MISSSAQMALDPPFVVFSISGPRSDPQSLAAYMQTSLRKMQSLLVLLTSLKITPCSSGAAMGRSGTRSFSLLAEGASCYRTIAFFLEKKETSRIIIGESLTGRWKNYSHRTLNSMRKFADIWPLVKISSRGVYGCSEFS